MLALNESNGNTIDPGKGVGDGTAVEVEVGSGVDVGGTGEAVCDGVIVGGIGDAVFDGVIGGATEAHPPTKIINRIME